MELMHTQTEGEVVYLLWIEKDYTPVRGNAMASGDDKLDREVEDEILARLGRGDTWAWASVDVEARHNDGRIGRDSLCGCNYRDTADFIENGCWEDLKAGALQRLGSD